MMSFRINIAMIAVVATVVPALGQADVEIKTTRLGNGIAMLEGNGGNIGVCTGDDGAFMIDDQFAPLSQKITAAVAELSEKPIKFLLNTHWHGDHTGGNENFGKAGAIIVAHENVRSRMSKENVMEAFGRTVPASPPGALPIVTFSDTMTFHWNDQEIHIFHVSNAHTDGDCIVHFKDANIVHMGDTFFNRMYPFIDPGSGGSVYGMIDAIEQTLTIVNESTKIIPGHGPLGNRDDLIAFRDMLTSVRDGIESLMAQGLDRDAIVAAHPTAAFDEVWGGGFFNADKFVGIAYDGMVMARQRAAATTRGAR